MLPLALPQILDGLIDATTHRTSSCGPVPGPLYMSSLVDYRVWGSKTEKSVALVRVMAQVPEPRPFKRSPNAKELTSLLAFLVGHEGLEPSASGLRVVPVRFHEVAQIPGSHAIGRGTCTRHEGTGEDTGGQDQRRASPPPSWLPMASGRF